MRTTVTLDEEVAEQLCLRMCEWGTGFKETLNEVIRQSLNAPAVEAERYEIPVFVADIRPGIDLDKALVLEAAMEADEIVRALGIGE